MINKPFLLSPAAKDYLWGGSRLNDDFNYGISMSPLAEVWVCSTHSDGTSFVDEYGCSLRELLLKHPEFLGTHAIRLADGELPILIKLIDADKDLSVQVHPDDEYARIHEDSLGKTEMWYVLDAENDSRIVYGFNHDVTSENVLESLESDKLESILNYIPVKKNDIFYIESGTVHAIGAGTLVVEIQENSNVTYRLYDYNRVDKDGRKRPLHIEKALDVIDLKVKRTPRQPLRLMKYRRGCANELLCRCKYFQVERMLLNTLVYQESVDYKTGSNSFHVLLATHGNGNISGDGFNIDFFKGDCIFVPADSTDIKLYGKADLLDVSC